MAYNFSPSDIERIADVFGTPARDQGGTSVFELAHAESGRSITVEIRSELAVPLDRVEAQSLVSVYAASSYLQLQGCTGFLTSRDTGEVIFFARKEGYTSGLVVEREAACSLYANVDDRLLTGDFTQLPAELVMSSVALSLTETFFDGDDGAH